jgi:hypothetical protein
MEGEPGLISVPLVWSGPEDLPIFFVNAFVSQFDQQSFETFVVTLGQITPPAIIGSTEEERREQAEQITFVPIKPIIRFSLDRIRMRELIATLQANLDQLEHATTMKPGDPR